MADIVTALSPGFGLHSLKKLKRYQYERYAVLCKLSYPVEFDHKALGFDHQVPIHNCRGIICGRILWRTAKKEVVVVFKGSQSIPDWLINLACLPKTKRFSDCKYRVHRGYNWLLEQPSTTPDSDVADEFSVFSRIRGVLLPLIDDGRRVTFTGHSSGGVMAVLAADWIERERTRSIKRVVTFGQPSPGFYSFKKAYPLHLRTYRICCDLDMVTFLPPLPWVFHHVGRMLWLHNERIYENISPRVRLGKSLLSWILLPITYHYMHKYIRNKDFFDKR